MSETAIKFSTVLGPPELLIVAQAVTTASSVYNLNSGVLAPYTTNGDYITIYCDQILYYRFSANPSATADNTAVAGANQVAAMDARSPQRMIVPKGMPYLALQAAGAGTVRIWASSATLA